MQFEDTIEFSERPIKGIERKPWQYNGFVSVEFFPGEHAPVRLTSVTDPDFSDLLKWVDDGNHLYADLEWVPDRKRGESHQPCLFQIGSSKGALIIRHPEDLEGSAELLQFLNSHMFYMKSMSQDLRKLRQRFGPDVQLSNMTDIEHLILRRLNAPLNFSKMVETLARSQPCAAFKNKRITCSNWGSEHLTQGQVIYAAFDVVALREVVVNSLPRVQELPDIAPERLPKKEKRQKAKRPKAKSRAKRSGCVSHAV